MQIVDRPPSEDQVIQSGETDRSRAILSAVFPSDFPGLVLWAALGIMFFSVLAVMRMLLSPFALILLPWMIPTILHFVNIISACKGINYIQYWITAEGVYVRQRSATDDNPVHFVPYREIVQVKCFDVTNGCGDLCYESGDKTSVHFGQTGANMERLLYAVPNVQLAAEIIRVQKSAYCRKLDEEAEETGQDVRQPERTLPQGSVPAPEQTDTHRSVNAPEQPDTHSSVTDPTQAFFGGVQMPDIKQKCFLDSAAESGEWKEIPPEESVADLQAELFGADAVQQGAFPDPTVNPLPELSDAQNDQRSLFTQQ